MPKACLSLLPTEDCEWSTWDIWRSSDVVEHAIYLGLALMLAYTFFVLIRFLRRYLSRHELRDFGPEPSTDHLRNRRKLVADLSQGLGTLKSIASTAPFLGLAGTAYGILCKLFFGNIAMDYFDFAGWISARIAFAFTTTLAGIVVAVPATIVHNLLRTRIESLTSTSFSPQTSATGGMHSFQFAQTLPLRRKFASLPPFAPLAAPVLACVVTLFTPFHPYRAPTGLRVLLPSFPCQPEVLSDRIIVLRVTKSGELFINTEPVSFTDLPRRLSAIYSTRTRRDLYLRSDEGVSFQTVADAIDTATKIRAPGFNSLDINVLVITPQAEAESEKCFALSLDRARRQFLRK